MKLRPRTWVLAVFLVIAGYLCFEHESQSRIVGGFALDSVEHLVDTSPIVDSDMIETYASMASKRSYAVEAECSDTGTNEQTVRIEMRGAWNHRIERTLQLQYSVEEVKRSQQGDVYLIRNAKNSQAVVFTKHAALPGDGLVLAIRKSPDATVRFDWVPEIDLLVHFVKGEWSVIDDRKLSQSIKPGEKFVFSVRDGAGIHLQSKAG